YSDSHGRIFLATDCFARAVAHGDDGCRGHDLDALADGIGQTSQVGLDLRGLSNEQRARLIVISERAQRPGDILARRVAGAHHIDGDSRHARAALVGAGAYSLSSVSSGFSITRLPR